MKKLFTKKSKIIITFDKHNLPDARIINANCEQVISASNLLISNCLGNNTKSITKQAENFRRNNKDVTFMFKLKRCFLRMSKEIFKKKVYKTSVLLHSMYR